MKVTQNPKSTSLYLFSLKHQFALQFENEEKKRNILQKLLEIFYIQGVPYGNRQSQYMRDPSIKTRQKFNRILLRHASFLQCCQLKFTILTYGWQHCEVVCTKLCTYSLIWYVVLPSYLIVLFCFLRSAALPAIY